MTSERSFYQSLLDHLRKEAKSCKDVKRLAAILSVSTGLIASVKTSREAVALVCSFLAHEFPRVRSLTAEKLYVRLLETDPELGDDHVAIRFLLQHDWESDGNQEQIIRDESIQEVTKAFEIDNEMMSLQE